MPDRIKKIKTIAEKDEDNFSLTVNYNIEQGWKILKFDTLKDYILCHMWK